LSRRDPDEINLVCAFVGGLLLVVFLVPIINYW
jgi:hypothetical protein